MTPGKLILPVDQDLKNLILEIKVLNPPPGNPLKQSIREDLIKLFQGEMELKSFLQRRTEAEKAWAIGKVLASSDPTNVVWTEPAPWQPGCENSSIEWEWIDRSISQQKINLEGKAFTAADLQQALEELTKEEPALKPPSPFLLAQTMWEDLVELTKTPGPISSLEVEKFQPLEIQTGSKQEGFTVEPQTLIPTMPNDALKHESEQMMRWHNEMLDTAISKLGVPNEMLDHDLMAYNAADMLMTQRLIEIEREERMEQWAQIDLYHQWEEIRIRHEEGERRQARKKRREKEASWRF